SVLSVGALALGGVGLQNISPTLSNLLSLLLGIFAAVIFEGVHSEFLGLRGEIISFNGQKSSWFDARRDNGEKAEFVNATKGLLGLLTVFVTVSTLLRWVHGGFETPEAIVRSAFHTLGSVGFLAALYKFVSIDEPEPKEKQFEVLGPSQSGKTYTALGFWRVGESDEYDSYVVNHTGGDMGDVIKTYEDSKPDLGEDRNYLPWTIGNNDPDSTNNLNFGLIADSFPKEYITVGIKDHAGEHLGDIAKRFGHGSEKADSGGEQAIADGGEPNPDDEEGESDEVVDLLEETDDGADQSSVDQSESTTTEEDDRGQDTTDPETSSDDPTGVNENTSGSSTDTEDIDTEMDISSIPIEELIDDDEFDIMMDRENYVRFPDSPSEDGSKGTNGNVKNGGQEETDPEDSSGDTTDGSEKSFRERVEEIRQERVEEGSDDMDQDADRSVVGPPPEELNADSELDSVERVNDDTEFDTTVDSEDHGASSESLSEDTSDTNEGDFEDIVNSIEYRIKNADTVVLLIDGQRAIGEKPQEGDQNMMIEELKSIASHNSVDDVVLAVSKADYLIDVWQER
ncbi:MAG: hypothetical protein ABEI86_11725, partial [Halobacteriaceae archaeon]